MVLESMTLIWSDQYVLGRPMFTSGQQRAEIMMLMMMNVQRRGYNLVNFTFYTAPATHSATCYLSVKSQIAKQTTLESAKPHLSFGSPFTPSLRDIQQFFRQRSSIILKWLEHVFLHILSLTMLKTKGCFRVHVGRMYFVVFIEPSVLSETCFTFL